MAIPNFTVKTKQIKKKRKTKSGRTLKSSAMKYYKYLTNKNAPSHEFTSIVNLKGNNDAIFEIERQIKNRELYRQANGLRGGGFNCEATSFVFSLPKDVYQPTRQEWLEIAKNAVKHISQATGIDEEKLWKQTATILHEEPNDDKCNHLHLEIGNVLDNEFLKALTQRKSTYAAKMAFNESMLKLGVDHKTYEPINENVGDKQLFEARYIKLHKKDLKLKERVRIANEILEEASITENRVDEKTKRLDEKEKLVDIKITKMEALKKQLKNFTKNLKSHINVFKNKAFENEKQKQRLLKKSAKNVVTALDFVNDNNKKEQAARLAFAEEKAELNDDSIFKEYQRIQAEKAESNKTCNKCGNTESECKCDDTGGGDTQGGNVGAIEIDKPDLKPSKPANSSNRKRRRRK